MKRKRGAFDEELSSRRPKLEGLSKESMREIRERNKKADLESQNPLVGLLGNYRKGPPSPDSEVQTFFKEITNSQWQECTDQSTGKKYYWNTETNEVTWDKPTSKQEEKTEKIEELSEEKQEDLQNQQIKIQIEDLSNRIEVCKNIQKEIEADLSKWESAKQPFPSILNSSGKLMGINDILSELKSTLLTLEIEFKVRSRDWKEGGLIPAFFLIKLRKSIEDISYNQAELEKLRTVIVNISPPSSPPPSERPTTKTNSSPPLSPPPSRDSRPSSKKPPAERSKVNTPVEVSSKYNAMFDKWKSAKQELTGGAKTTIIHDNSKIEDLRPPSVRRYDIFGLALAFL